MERYTFNLLWMLLLLFSSFVFFGVLANTEIMWKNMGRNLVKIYLNGCQVVIIFGSDDVFLCLRRARVEFSTFNLQGSQILISGPNMVHYRVIVPFTFSKLIYHRICSHQKSIFYESTRNSFESF